MQQIVRHVGMAVSFHNKPRFYTLLLPILIIKTHEGDCVGHKGAVRIRIRYGSGAPIGPWDRRAMSIDDSLQRLKRGGRMLSG